MRLLPCLLVALIALASAEDGPAVTTVVARDLGRRVQVIGTTGRALGTMTTIVGTRVEGASKADHAEIVIALESVDGAPIADARITLRYENSGLAPAAIGTRHTYRGYEDGGFAGMPRAALDEMKGEVPQTQEYFFATWFLVMDEPAAAAPAPAP